jgi:hypothetical protein
MSTDQNMRDPEKPVGTKQVYGSSIQVRNKNKNNLLDMTSLIRSIQRSEGNLDCFLKGAEDCDRTDCAWRLYCVGEEPKF